MSTWTAACGRPKNAKRWGMKGGCGWAPDNSRVLLYKVPQPFLQHYWTLIPCQYPPPFFFFFFSVAADCLRQDLLRLGGHSPIQLTEQTTREIWQRCWSQLRCGHLNLLLHHQKERNICTLRAYIQWVANAIYPSLWISLSPPSVSLYRSLSHDARASVCMYGVCAGINLSDI